jgi:DegV family protein with EDD domain
MKHPSVAILVDSGSDVPPEYVSRYGMFVIPLLVQYHDREYRDSIDITPQDVYDRFAEEIPTTSLPSLGMVKEVVQRIVDEGYSKLVAIAISSGLSGTYNAIKMAVEEFPDVESMVIDTKNISVGSGFTAILTAQLLEQGLAFADLKERIHQSILNSKVFFCVNTLEYLKKGGRIGLVTSMIGSVLNIKPIISCNDDGIYYNAAQSRGRSKSLKKALEMAVDFARGHSHYNLAVVHGDAAEEAADFGRQIRELLPDADIIVEGQISPALVVHTGPGLLGIGVQRLT